VIVNREELTAHKKNELEHSELVGEFIHGGVTVLVDIFRPDEENVQAIDIVLQICQKYRFTPIDQ